MKQTAILLTGLALLGCTPRADQLRESPRCVFIDGGAHFGESYVALQQTRLYSEYKWEVFAIEANPYLIPDLPKVPHLTVIDKALWTKAEKLTFHLESPTSGANSLYDKFQEHEEAFTVEVQAFDFSQWLKETVSPEDYVVLSLDVEGAEYVVLDKMIEDGAVKYIDRLYTELHWNLLLDEMSQNEAMGRGRRLMRHFERAGVIVADDSLDGIIIRGDWIDFLAQAPVREDLSR